MSISREPELVWSRMTTHFNRNAHFFIRVWYNIYPSRQQKWLKLPFWLKSPEKVKIRNTIKNRLYEHNWTVNRIIWPPFHMHISYKVYPLEKQVWLILSFWLRLAEKDQISYLLNHNSYEVDWPLILTKMPTFLCVFHIICTHQSNRNDWNSQFCLKIVCQNDSRSQ